MLLYRITKEKYLLSLTGRGKSFMTGARWNKAGLPILYFASNAGVALLEMANYIPSPRLVPKSYRLGIYEVPEETSIETLPITEVPPNWAIFPYPTSTQKIGSEWLQSGSSLCLRVPSVAVPAGLESNILVNPLHPEMTQLQLVEVKQDLYNQRAFQGI